MPSSSVHCLTLGCDKNLVDSEALLGRFRAAGFSVAADRADADVLILNSCGFIDAARSDSREALAELIGMKGPEQILVVTGCWSQEHGERIAADFPGVDVIGGVGEFDRLVAAVEEVRRRAPDRRPDVLRLPTVSPRKARYTGFDDRSLLTPPHVAFVKISEGCSRSCTFCRIPLIRGKMQSRSIERISAEVEGLVDRGVREIQLVSQITSDYGRDRDESLLELVRRLDGIAELRRIRLLYLYAGMLPEETLLEILAVPKVVHYLDMPVQHAVAGLLRAMKRPGDPERTAEYFEALRREIPDLVLRTTILLGFPGEEDEDIEDLADFLARVKFDHLGTYRYSPEAGTPAAELPNRPAVEVVADREALILDLQAEIAMQRQLERLGGEFEVVIDEIRPGDECRELLEALAEGVGENDAEPDGPETVGDDDPVAIGRSVHFGYDLDGVVLLHGVGLEPGDWIRCRFAAVTPFDCWATSV